MPYEFVDFVKPQGTAKFYLLEDDFIKGGLRVVETLDDLMGVTVGDNVIIGAGSIVIKDIPANSVAAGNPAKVICSLDDYLKKEALEMTEENTFDEEFTLRNKNFNTEHASKMIEACRKYRKAYVK